jgi:hypothetical protein
VQRVLRRVAGGIRALPNLLRGYNLYVNPAKLRLIDLVFGSVVPGAGSFADLGGVWKVNAAYTRYALSRFPVDRAVLVDTHYPPALWERLQRDGRLEVLRGDFASEPIVRRVGGVDVVFFFDVLLHQANPDWDQVLGLYAERCPCMVVYNQQYVLGEEAVRLTDLPLSRYLEIASGRPAFAAHVYAHAEEIHPQHRKRWKDIHSITQWGISDRALRGVMARLGYEEVYFKNYGRFLDLRAFENHAFVFRKNAGAGSRVAAAGGEQS